MSDDYRSFNTYVGHPSSGTRGQLTLRGKPDESAKGFAERVLNELAGWRAMGWEPERPFLATPQTDSASSVPDDPFGPGDLSGSVPDPHGAQSDSGAAHIETNGQEVMRIRMLKIAASTEGLPELHFYTHYDANSHKWPDLKYTLGKDQTDRVKNCLALLKGTGNGWKVEHLQPGKTYGNGTDTSELDLDVTWKVGKNPKYKDVVAVTKHGSGH